MVYISNHPSPVVHLFSGLLCPVLKNLKFCSAHRSMFLHRRKCGCAYRAALTNALASHVCNRSEIHT
jgi:hypothetical protein